MKTWKLDGRTVHYYPTTKQGAPLIYLNGTRLDASLILPDHHLVIIEDIDWHHDLAPWPMGPLFKKDLPYTGGADAYLDWLVNKVAHPLEDTIQGGVPWRGLVGYSLAGLFSIYALYQTDHFERVASVSGSLWYPGFLTYARTHTLCCQPQKVYLSLGDREHRTRHPLMKEVAHCTQALTELLDCPVIFQSQPGNHFDHLTDRLRQAIQAL